MGKVIVICLILVMILLTWYRFRTSSGESDSELGSDTNTSDEIARSMEEFKNRKQYSSLTPKILASIPDDKLEQAIIDYIFVKIGTDYERSYEVVTGLSDGFQMVYTTWCVEAEVNNGGFNQYFWNSSGQFAEEALIGFQLIGANEHSKLMEQAITIFVKEEPQQKQFKLEGTLEAFSESCKHTDLSQVDSAFFDLSEDLQALRIQYIREHPNEFKS